MIKIIKRIEENAGNRVFFVFGRDVKRRGENSGRICFVFVDIRRSGWYTYVEIRKCMQLQN